MVYKQDEQFRSWLNGLYPGWMVEAVTTFIRVAPYQVPWGSFNKHWQLSLTCEPHHLYYICHLWETFQWDTAEMAPCWLYLVASFSHVFRIVHVNVDHPQGPCSSHPAHVQARFLMTWPCRLIDPLSDSACPWPVINRTDQFIIRLNG